MPLTRGRIAEILCKVRNLRIGVVGDFCLDRYGTAEIGGQSRETGNAIFRIDGHLFSPGGGANIAWNVAEIGAESVALTILGADPFGTILRNVLREKRVRTDWIVENSERFTPSFEKIRVRKDQVEHEVRWDVVNRRPVPPAAEEQYVAAIRKAAPRLSCLIVADYDEAGSGILTEPVVECLCEIGKRGVVPIFATSRLRIGAFRPVTAVINEYEAVVAAGVATGGPLDAIAPSALHFAGHRLASLNDRDAFVTSGKLGMVVYRPDGERSSVPTVEATGEIDPVGAGDTALAAIASSVCAGASPTEAAMLGNVAANVTVRKVGITGAASPEEILRAHDAWFQTED